MPQQGVDAVPDQVHGGFLPTSHQRHHVGPDPLYTPFALHVTLGQDYLPGRPGTASGVTLGLAVSVGGLAAPAVGAIANASTLQLALLSLVVLPALAYAAARGMIDPHHEPRPQQTVASIGV